MALQDLKKLTEELKKLAGMLSQVREKDSRRRIHKRAFQIMRQIEKGGGNDRDIFTFWSLLGFVGPRREFHAFKFGFESGDYEGRKIPETISSHTNFIG